LVAAVLLGAPACALLAGIEEPRDRPEGGPDDATTPDGASAETGAHDSGTKDATSDVATNDATPGTDGGVHDAATDAAADAGRPDGCVDGGPEICNDGVDNDCNGATDCQDSACVTQGYACVPTIPGGWVFGALAPTTRACAAGYSSESYVSATGSPASCNCSCAVGQPPQCGGAAITVQTGSDTTCSGGAQSFSTSGCNVSSASPAFIMAGPVAATGGTCIAQTMDTIPTVAVTNWYSCQSNGPFGTCSSPNEVCAWVGAASKCVTAPGVQSCPAGYTSASHALGSGYDDTRACTPACGGCDPTPTASCSDATFTFYSGSSCNGGAIPVTLDGTCTSTVENSLSYRYSATAQGASCGTPTTQTAIGAVTLNGTTTACCTN
jgi:hypothetical protein